MQKLLLMMGAVVVLAGCGTEERDESLTPTPWTPWPPVSKHPKIKTDEITKLISASNDLDEDDKRREANLTQWQDNHLSNVKRVDLRGLQFNDKHMEDVGHLQNLVIWKAESR